MCRGARCDLTRRLHTILIHVWAPFAHLLWYSYTLIFGTLSLLLWPFDRTGALQHGCARWWCRLIAWTIGARLRVHGTEHVSRGRGYVYMANHASLLDTPAMFACLPFQFKIIAKKELFRVPFMGWHLWSSGHFPIDRRDGRKTAGSLRRVIAGVGAGTSLAVFPEGTRTPDGRLQAFRPGGFKIAVRARVPIVPVTIRGTFTLLPRRTLVPCPGRVDVFIGTPIDTGEYTEQRLAELIVRTRTAIELHLEPDARSTDAVRPRPGG